MRTTITLPAGVGTRVRRLAEQRNQSVSSTVAALVASGLSHTQEPNRVSIDPVTGFPKISFGHALTSEDVALLIDEDA